MELLREMLLQEKMSLKLDSTFEQVKKDFGSTGKLAPTLSSRNVKFHLDTLTKGYFDKFEEKGSPFAFCGARLHEIWWEQFNGGSGDASEVVKQLGHESVDDFVEAVQGVAETLQGNGWAVVTKDAIVTCPNHSWSAFDDIVLLIDLWEHAYQVDYKADKMTYIKKVIKDSIAWVVS